MARCPVCDGAGRVAAGVSIGTCYYCNHERERVVGPNELTWGTWNDTGYYVYDTSTWNTNWTTGTTGVWTNWVTTTNTNGWLEVTAENTVWPNWVNATGSTIPVQIVGADGVPLNPWQPWVAQQELTQEQRDRLQAEAERRNREALERQRAYEEQQAARRAEIEKDRGRAKRLLNSTLNVHQRHQMKHYGFFEVTTKSGKKYRIRKGTHGNVRLLDNRGREINSYCIAPVNASQVPDEDTMVAQKLALEGDEERFLRVANARRLVA